MTEVIDEVEQNWEEFWEPLVTKEDGTIDIEQIKKELCDFSDLMERTGKVFDYVTGSRISKVNTPADAVMKAADEHYTFVYEEQEKFVNDVLEAYQMSIDPEDLGRRIEKIVETSDI